MKRNNMKTKKTPSHQTTIFDWLKQAQAEASQNTCIRPGSCDIDAELRAAISADLKHARNTAGRELSRYETAALMSELVGQEITASMLYNWTADSHEKHRMPAQLLPAFAQVTGGRRALEAIARNAGVFVLPGEEALRAEIRRIDEQINKLKTAKHRRETLLKEVER
jgi:hypothetical protein